MASTELPSSSRRRRPSTAHDEGLPVAATDEAPPATASSAPARPNASKPPRTKGVAQHVRLTFTLGVLNACLVTFLIARSLFASVAWYLMKAVVLLTYRFVAFRARKQHYYLLDFCYFVNVLVIVFFVRVYVFGVTDVALFKALYAMCHGPLAWSVVIFDNKLIFHSVQHLISVFIHMSPALLTMAVRWSRDPEFHALSAFGAEATETETGAPAGALGWAQKLGSDGGALVRDSFVPYYLGWIVVYSLVIFVLRAKRIRERAYETLFTYLIQKDGPLQRVIRRSTKNEKLQQLFYVSVHALFSLGTTLLAAVWWNWELGNLVFVGLIGATAIWNASGSSIKEVDFFQMEQAPNPDDEPEGQRRE